MLIRAGDLHRKLLRVGPDTLVGAALRMTHGLAITPENVLYEVLCIGV